MKSLFVLILFAFPAFAFAAQPEVAVEPFTGESPKPCCKRIADDSVKQFPLAASEAKVENKTPANVLPGT